MVCQRSDDLLLFRIRLQGRTSHISTLRMSHLVSNRHRKHHTVVATNLAGAEQLDLGRVSCQLLARIEADRPVHHPFGDTQQHVPHREPLVRQTPFPVPVFSEQDFLFRRQKRHKDQHPVVLFDRKIGPGFLQCNPARRQLLLA